MSEPRPWEIKPEDVEAYYKGFAGTAAQPESVGFRAESRDADDTDEPRFLREARIRAEDQGVDVETILADDAARARAMEYPGPECLSPEQIEACIVDGPDEAESRHLDACAGCRVMLSVAEPSPSRRIILQEAVRRIESKQAAYVGELVVASTKVDGWNRFWPQIPARAAFFGAVACSFLVGILVSKLVDRSSSGPATLAVSPSGENAVVANQSGRNWLLDLKGGRTPVEFQTDLSPQFTFDFSDDGKHLAAQGKKGGVEVWDLNNLENGIVTQPQVYDSMKAWAAVRKATSEPRSEPGAIRAEETAAEAH